MSWTLLVPVSHGSDTVHHFALSDSSNAHLVLIGTVRSVVVVNDLQASLHTELGRITVGPYGAKLEAINHLLSIQAGHASLPSAANDPRTTRYELQPRTDEHSEIILLRHGDVITSSMSTSNLTCVWNESEVQVNSSAAEAGIVALNGVEGVVETPEEETEDEDLDKTITAVKATQSKSQQPQATPQLSNQRSVIIQETPTAARVNGVTDSSVPIDFDQHEPVGDTPTPEPTIQAEAEPYCTARTGQSQNGTNTLTIEATEAKGLHDQSVAAVVHISEPAEDGLSDDTPQKSRHPKVLISRKRPSPAIDEADSDTELVGRSNKRAKKYAPSDNDTQDNRLSNIVVDTSPAAVPTAKKGRKRKSEITELDEVMEVTPSRSQRSSQRSNSVATTEPYQGNTPRVATSNSTISEKSHAVKFLKKQGGSLTDSVKEPFNVLCVRDGNLHKTPKVLQAIAAGTPIVTDKWLTDSAKTGHFLSVDAYQPSAPKQEQEWSFRLVDVLGQPQTPFEGYTIHFTTSLHSAYRPFTEIEQVCKAAGAKVTKKKMDKSEKVIVLAVDEGDKEAEKLMQDGVTCYKRDLLPFSILRGVLDLDSDEFKISAEDAPKETKKTRGKKS